MELIVDFVEPAPAAVFTGSGAIWAVFTANTDLLVDPANLPAGIEVRALRSTNASYLRIDAPDALTVSAVAQGPTWTVRLAPSAVRPDRFLKTERRPGKGGRTRIESDVSGAAGIVWLQDPLIGEDMAAINRLFTPEFRNRLDAVVPFAPLPADVVHRVVEKFVMQLEAQLADRNVTFELSEEAIQWLAEEGYDEKMGARPLGRVIQEHIKRPLADKVLFGELKKGGTVRVTVEEDEDGKKTLALEAIADPGPARGAVDDDGEDDIDGEDGSDNGGGGNSMVPRVPLSG